MTRPGDADVPRLPETEKSPDEVVIPTVPLI